MPQTSNLKPCLSNAGECYAARILQNINFMSTNVVLVNTMRGWMESANV